MARRGPLIPGLREYDAPRRRRAPAIWVWTLAVIFSVGILVVVGGIAAGIGPLRAFGVVETSLTPVAWRPGETPAQLQVAVGLPDSGLCTGDEVFVRVLERPSVVEVSAIRAAPRSSADCAGIGIAGDRTWVDVRLADDLGDRTVIRMPDRIPLPLEEDEVVGES
jgi:hypothetical protein